MIDLQVIDRIIDGKKYNSLVLVTYILKDITILPNYIKVGFWRQKSKYELNTKIGCYHEQGCLKMGYMMCLYPGNAIIKINCQIIKTPKEATKCRLQE